MEQYLELACSFISKLSYQDLNSQVIDQGKCVLLDTLGAILSGSKSPEVENLIELNRRSTDEEGSTILGRSEKFDPKMAALINGIAATWHELDEGSYFSKGHAGIHVIPAALAMGEKLRVSGRKLLTSIIAGYEISSRIGLSIQLKKGMHPHGTWGTIGASIAVAKLLMSTAEEADKIINLASSLTLATSKQTVIRGANVEKSYAGISNFMGIFANELFRSGFKYDEHGLNEIFSKISSDFFDHQMFENGIGESYQIMRNYFKNDACCRYISPTLDAVRIIMHKKKLKPEEIKRIEVQTFELASILGKKDPDEMLAAKFSIPYNVALLIIKGSCDIDYYSDAFITDDEIRRLAVKVETKENREFSKRFPEQRPSRVTIALRDGTRISKTVFYGKGDAEDPYSQEEIENKFLRLVTPVVGEKRARHLLLTVTRLEEVEDIRLLFC